MSKAVVYKYQIEPGNTTISMPHGASPLNVQPQGMDIVMWALCPLPFASYEDRHFECYGTGHIIEDTRDLTFIGTFQIPGGSPLVFHLFERAP